MALLSELDEKFMAAYWISLHFGEDSLMNPFAAYPLACHGDEGMPYPRVIRGSGKPPLSA
jgi:hypothetical protein